MGLAARYLAVRPDRAPDPELEARLGAVCGAAADALAPIGVEAEALVDALAGLPKELDRLDPSRVEELALALACARGDRAALARMERDYFGAIPRMLGAMKLSPAHVDDIAATLRERLLVGDPPKIVGLAGRGSLRGLLKVSATRAALDLLRKEGREVDDEAALAGAVAERDPELGYLKARYRAVFKAAFEEAVDGLSARERNLLRLHFLRRVTLEDLARMYAVHRATIVRHLARARDAIERGTRRALSERLGLSAAELDEVMALVASRWEVSAERLLRTRAGDDEV